MKGSAFSKNFNAMFALSGKTQDDVASALGVDRVTVYNWRNGRSAKPKSQSVIDSIKALFGVTDAELFGYADGFYAKLYGLSDAPMDAMAPSEPKRAYAPLYGRVHAGGAGEPDLLCDEVPIPYEVLEHHPNGYWLEVEGTCMDKVYPEGCHIFIDPDMQPRDGSIAVVSIDGGDYVMRRLKLGVTTVLLCPESHDPSWEDIVVSGDHELRLVGTVVWFQAGREMR